MKKFERAKCKQVSINLNIREDKSYEEAKYLNIKQRQAEIELITSFENRAFQLKIIERINVFRKKYNIEPLEELLFYLHLSHELNFEQKLIFKNLFEYRLQEITGIYDLEHDDPLVIDWLHTIKDNLIIRENLSEK